MHVATFVCPHCAIPLRVRDRRFVGRTISCPECREPVTIAEAQGSLVAVAAESSPNGAVTSPAKRRVSPTSVGWIVAGCLAVGVGLFINLPGSQHPEDHEVASGTKPDGNLSKADDRQQPAADDVPKASTVAEKLAALHGWIAPASEAGEAFPIGTVAAEGLPVPQRFSWIAALVAANDPDGPQLQWKHGWSDPANERFVRRQRPRWLNPSIEAVVSEQRYPATHFVGVAGVGPDAASLPVGHPRAGIFGDNRRVRLEDVGDGLTNTMLIAGVEAQLGSWAAGGEATVRGFTAEPYLRGPDGFGAGEADGMHVLMADGSVRFLSRDIDPVVVRRMAAMNDGLPLDADVPGEPGDASEGPADVTIAQAGANDEEPEGPDRASSLPIDAAQVIAELAGPQEMPIDVLLAEPLPVYDVEAALGQPIVEFQQKEPVPIRDLLRLVEEMAAVPIHEAELPTESRPLLDQPITLTLSDKTVGDILKSILETAALTFDARPEGIYLRAEDAVVE